MRIYADTSVFGGVFDTEFDIASKHFFDEVIARRHELVVSVSVDDEIEDAPEVVRAFYQSIVGQAEIFQLTPEVLVLRDAYLNAGVLTEKSLTDATHVALATVLGCQKIVSWNLKHIVNTRKIPQYNAINEHNGYNSLEILTPADFLKIMTISEPKCVQWKRRGQARIREKIAGMTHEEELAYWNESYKKLMRTHAESKRRLQEKQATDESPAKC